MGYYVSTLFVPLTPDELDNWFKAHAMLDMDPVIPVPEMGDEDSQPARYHDTSVNQAPADLDYNGAREVDLSKSSMTISQQCEEAAETGICADGQRCGPAFCEWCPNREKCTTTPVQEFGETDNIPGRYRCIDCKDPLRAGERVQCDHCAGVEDLFIYDIQQITDNREIGEAESHLPSVGDVICCGPAFTDFSHRFKPGQKVQVLFSGDIPNSGLDDQVVFITLDGARNIDASHYSNFCTEWEIEDRAVRAMMSTAGAKSSGAKRWMERIYRALKSGELKLPGLEVRNV